QEHTDAFREARVKDFESRAVRHIRRDLPDHTSRHTDDELGKLARRSIPRARAYGLLTERQVMCFIDVSILLGEGFDKDPRHSWAAQVLNSQKLAADDKAHLILATACSLTKDSKAAR